MPLSLALAACLLMAAGEASAAKKKSRPKKPGPLVSRSVTVPLPPHQLGTAVATCPPKTTAVGGGFAGSPGGIEPTVVTESRLASATTWTVSGLRAHPLTTVAGELTATVRCRRRAPRITAAAASISLPAALSPGDHPSTAANARCPGRQRAISGGFASEADPKLSLAALPQQSQRVENGRAWTFGASHNNPSARLLTAYAYCARGLLRSKAGAVSLSGDLTTEPAETRPCGRRLAPVSGGFAASAPTLGGGGDVVYVLASQPRARAWRALAMHAGSKTTGSLKSFLYCG